MKLQPVIIAGGSGTRLWPLSRSMYPKQFIDLVSDRSMLQDTVLRLEGMDCAAPIIICNQEYRFLVAQQLAELEITADIILEPFGRNTAPAIALAALYTHPQDMLLIMAADHVIEDIAAFQNAAQQAAQLAQAGYLTTFGITPNSANTGYGYIKAGESLNGGRQVASFAEKPDQKTAELYLASDDYFWNSGMFLFRSKDYLEELKVHRPDIAQVCEQTMRNIKTDSDFIRINSVDFNACPAESIDYAVMEKTQKAAMVELSAGWSDIGSWKALWEIGNHDHNHNVLRGKTITLDTKNSFLYSQDRLVAALGLDEMVVIDTKDAVLVASMNAAQDIKKIVEILKEQGSSQHESHREVFRPWGKYDSVDVGESYQVKRITVIPGAKLSVQMHHHRAEHWVVVSGIAEVTKDNETFVLKENESTFIPIGCVHALRNPGGKPLELIEIQTGSYLGEDDIVRFEDIYGRISE